MKKLLSIAFCAAAALAASAAETISTNLTTVVGVIPVTLPAGQQNTIISAAFKGLDGNANTIANFIKTTNLAQGDKILLFNGGEYSAWVLGSDKKWAKTETTFSLDSAGNVKINTGAETSTTVTAGHGLWIIRNDATQAATIAIYGEFIAEPSTEVSASTWTLVGNAGLKEKTITNGEEGDKIVTVVSGALREYNYSEANKTWYYQTYEDGVRTVHAENPTIAAGVGFWYYTQSKQTISWVNE